MKIASDIESQHANLLPDKLFLAAGFDQFGLCYTVSRYKDSAIHLFNEQYPDVRLEIVSEYCATNRVIDKG